MGRRPTRTCALAFAVAVTLGSAACQAGSTPPKTSSSDRSTDTGRALTQEEATLALPIRADLPVDGYVDTEPSDVDPDQSSYPAVCKDVTMSGAEARELNGRREAHAERGYRLSEGGYVSVRLSSFADPVPTAPFDAAGDAVGQCGSFQLIDKHGTTSWDLGTLAFPSMGDRTYAIRVKNTTKKDDGYKGTVDLAVIARGHNLVRIVYAVTPPSTHVPDLPEKIAEVVLKNLENA